MLKLKVQNFSSSYSTSNCLKFTQTTNQNKYLLCKIDRNILNFYDPESRSWQIIKPNLSDNQQTTLNGFFESFRRRDDLNGPAMKGVVHLCDIQSGGTQFTCTPHTEHNNGNHRSELVIDEKSTVCVRISYDRPRNSYTLACANNLEDIPQANPSHWSGGALVNEANLTGTQFIYTATELERILIKLKERAASILGVPPADPPPVTDSDNP